MKRFLIAFLTIFISLALAQVIKPVDKPFQVNPAEYKSFTAPRWSPDGKKIMVSGANYTGIYLITFPEGKVEMISDEPSAGWGARWSHNGKWIAARVAKYENNRRLNQVVVYDTESKTRQALSSWESLLPGTPFWTTNDDMLYLSSTDKMRLYPLSKSSQQPKENFAYVKNDRLFLYGSADKQEKAADLGTARILAITPSPDNKLLAVEKFDGTLTITQLDGSQPVEIGRGFQPTWSPDSRFICYTYALDDGHRYTYADLFIATADGKSRFQLTTTDLDLEMNPSWSPDGQWIAYELMNKGSIMVQALEMK